MKDLLLALLNLAVTAAKLCRRGGVRAVIAENLLLKQQLIVLRRARKRAPNLRAGDRVLCGFGSLFLSPGRIRKVAIGVRPSTLLTFHRALVRRKYRHLFSSGPRPQKPGPKGPSEALIRAIVELKSRNPRFGCPRCQGPARRSSEPSSNSSHAIPGSGVRGLRVSSPRRSGSRSTRTSCTACWRNTLVQPLAEAGRRGCRSSDTRQTVCGASISFAVNPSCSGAIGCS